MKGQLIGNYKILEEIGRGGMGIVYKAQHSMIQEKIMAIKTIHDFIISLTKVIERFKQEANVMYSLRNPNIVYVEDIAEQDGIYFIVMEYVEGESLRQRLQREKTIPVDDALNIALKICQGLEVAHSRKPPVIHRDLKPENILIAKNNEIKVTDFGLAKIVGDSNISMMSKISIGEIPTAGISERKELSIGDLPTDVKDGISQISPGTFAYMSPEQRRGEELDTRTDIYSLGLILYEMLIGELPAGLRPKLPSHVLTEAIKELDEILFRSLEGDRKERYGSINELKVELTNQQKRVVVEPEIKSKTQIIEDMIKVINRRIFERQGRVKEVEYRPTHLIHPWAMFRHDPQHKGRSPYNGPKYPRLKWKYYTMPYLRSSPAIGANGTIYIGSNNCNIYAINPDGSKKWEFTTGWIDSSPAIGSDSTIYVGSYNRWFYAINPDGTLKWKYKTGGKIKSSPAIGTHGTIYVGSGYSLHAINPNGSKKWSFATKKYMESSPAIGADGTIYVGSWNHKLYAINPDGSKKWEFIAGEAISSSPAVGADGTIYVGAEKKKLYAINPDGSKKWEFATGGITFSSPAIGADGTIYVGSRDNKLYAINPDGSKKWEFVTGDEVSSSPAIGADGTIYVGSDDDKVYAINPDGSEKWSFDTEVWVKSSPAIGADGTIYIGSDNGNLYAIGEK